MALTVINVPKTDASAYNPNRAAGKLLQAQAAHLREALIQHLHELSAILKIDLRSLKTEGDISAYIQKVTAVLHPHGAKPTDKRGKYVAARPR
jgi:hypothetical protein